MTAYPTPHFFVIVRNCWRNTEMTSESCTSREITGISPRNRRLLAISIPGIAIPVVGHPGAEPFATTILRYSCGQYYVRRLGCRTFWEIQTRLSFGKANSICTIRLALPGLVGTGHG